MRRLLTIDEAADRLGVPKRSLQAAAERHGFLIRIGRALRLDPDDIPALVAACKQVTPPAKRPVLPILPQTKHGQITFGYTAAAAQHAADELKKLKRKRPE